MTNDSGENRKKGITRRLFLNRSMTATGGAVILANAASWPAWAETVQAEGVRSRMGRLAVDRSNGRTWLCKLEIELGIEDIETEWGPTRFTRSVDSIAVSSKDGGEYDEPIDVSGGQPEAKLAPQIAASGGRACVVWCGCHPETRQWRSYAAYFDGHEWSPPMEIAGGARPALHPRVTMCPETGKAWIAYEDWGDHSIKLTSFDGSAWSGYITVSESGQNYRPKLIVTDRAGRNRGKVAMVWDSYRDLQYDIYFRLVDANGGMGDEVRVTECARWDSQADVAEDLDGNLWVAWVRASNELSQMSAMRSVHVKFFDGNKWLFPHPPEKLYNPSEFATARLGGMSADDHREMLRALQGEGGEIGDGRVSWYSVTWSPTLQVDKRNRVYVFYLEGDPLIFAMYRHLDYRRYEGSRWSGPKRIKLGRGGNIIQTIFDQAVAINGDRIEAVWDRLDLMKGPQVTPAQQVKIRGLNGPMTHPQGQDLPETMYEGWKVRETFEPPPRMKINGEVHTMVYGDTHVHSITSDGADPSDYYYNFARDYAKLDFFGLSDHDVLIANIPGIEAYISFLPKIFSTPDFVCFQGYEFTSQAKGHRCVLFEGDDRPVIDMSTVIYPKDDRTTTNGMLYGFLHKFGLSPEARVMVTAHNMFNLGNDFSQYDESMEPLYDVMSLHVAAEKSLQTYMDEGVIEKGGARGISLLMNGFRVITGDKSPRDIAHKWFSCWKEALADALPLGAYGASDTHAVSGLGWITAGLWVREKTRKSIFDAMFERRSIAIDNQARNFEVFNTFPFLERRVKDRPVRRMDIRFWLDDAFMGAKPRLDRPPTARALARSQDPNDRVRSIVFVKNGQEVFKAQDFGPGQAEASWEDKQWSRSKTYYYIRVEFESGNEGYSSPVFANY